jgi:serine/threonine protein kinase
MSDVALPSGYTYVRDLGQGSMARVHLARNTLLKRLVAIKVLLPTLARDEIAVKRFMREAQAAARISHPHVTSVYAVGTLENALPYIEMQYVEGTTLADLLQSQGPLEPDVVRDYLIQVAGALAAAHDCRVIHRDVKPANVLIDRDRQNAYLTDFGVAGILESGSEMVTRLTRESERLGNPRYMSPEQLRGEQLTELADIYSFGILGYEMLTGHGTFGNSREIDIENAHIRGVPIDLCENYPAITADLGDLLKRCIAKKAPHRPSAKALVAMLQPGSNESSADAPDREPPSGALTGFLAELQKRKVYRAAATYAFVTIGVLTAADLILPAIEIGERLYRWIVIGFLSGFPVAMWLSWVYDLKGGRLTRSEELDRIFARRASQGQRLLLQSFGLGVSALISIAIAWWLL